jgi:hypothetical protein
MAGIQLKNGVVNQFGAPSINENTLANRPTFGQTGRLFVDTTNNVLQRDTGTSWVDIGAVATTPTLQAVCTAGSTFTPGSITIYGITLGRGGLGLTENTGLGTNALTSINNSFGNYNTAIGYNSMSTSTSSNSNTCVGYNSGTAMTSALQNVCIGMEAGSTMTTHSANTFVGQAAGRYTRGSYNTCIGNSCDTQGSIGNYAGSNNTYVGYGIGGNVQAYTSYNTFIGNATAGGYQGNGINGLNTIIGALLSVSASPTITGNIIMGDNTGKKIQMYSTFNWVLGGGADNGIHQLQLSGGLYCQTLSPSGVTWSVNTTITLGSSNFYYVYTGAGGSTITMPTASANNNIYTFINSTNMTYTISTSSSQNILRKNIGTLVTSFVASGYSSHQLIADGNNKFYEIV